MEETILNSFKKEITCMIYAGSLESIDFETEILNISDIHSVVTDKSRRQMKGYNPLKKSIFKSGMIDPIIVILNNIETWKAAIFKIKEEYINYPNYNKKYIALTGNSRLTMAKDMGFIQIEAIIVPNMVWMHTVQLNLQGGVIKHEV